MRSGLVMLQNFGARGCKNCVEAQFEEIIFEL
jgi:hypothetical protein